MCGGHEDHDRIETALDAKAGDTALPGSEIEERWLNLVHREVRLKSKRMRDAIREQGKADNRSKPIGLYCGDMGLVLLQDPAFDMADDADTTLSPEKLEEKKRRSLIESCAWHACESDAGPGMDPDDIAAPVARLLGEANVRLPDSLETEQQRQEYVRDLVHEYIRQTDSS